ncbi:MAG TPA: YbjQ family protein [Candidatus Paceibacterota bacterium]|nr:YbjQ family protein [Candidatus Paceibacterota bacterium]
METSRKVSEEMVTTAFELPGYRIVKNHGVVRGIIVRSRNLIVNIGAGLHTLIGGNITAYTNLCERTRVESFEKMLMHAGELGANAVIGARYDANEVAAGVAEVLAYGTAVTVEKI